jgi:hypothetical protein
MHRHCVIFALRANTPNFNILRWVKSTRWVKVHAIQRTANLVISRASVVSLSAGRHLIARKKTHRVATGQGQLPRPPPGRAAIRLI